MELVRIDLEERRKRKMLSEDRTFILKTIDPSKPRTASGLIDHRVIGDESKIHAKLEKSSSLWYLSYDGGVLPQPLKQRWTSFQKLLTFTTDYFSKRNLQIVEIKA